MEKGLNQLNALFVSTKRDTGAAQQSWQPHEGLSRQIRPCEGIKA